MEDATVIFQQLNQGRRTHDHLAQARSGTNQLDQLMDRLST